MEAHLGFEPAAILKLLGAATFLHVSPPVLLFPLLLWTALLFFPPSACLYLSTAAPEIAPISSTMCWHNAGKDSMLF